MDDHLGAGLQCILQSEVAAVHGGLRRWKLFSRRGTGIDWAAVAVGAAVVAIVVAVNGEQIAAFPVQPIEPAEHLAQVIVNPVAVGVGEPARASQHTDPVCDGVQVRPAGSVAVDIAVAASWSTSICLG
jgi:hypothetical protein